MFYYNLVSVILPVYNGEQFVARAIESVLNQTYKELELIVVDDGSSDNSLDVVQSYADSRLKVLTKENGGPASARNFGIQHCSGEYVALIDQDDLWYPKKLEKQLGLLLCAASTHEGEEGLILKAFAEFKKEQTDARLILAPRHPERFDKIEKKIMQ